VTWLEVGEGDRDYYPAPHAPIWDAIDTVIRPTLARSTSESSIARCRCPWRDASMMCILVSARGLDRHPQFIHDSNELQHGVPVRMFNSSHLWITEAPKAAGVPVVPLGLKACILPGGVG
jgi:hypothetical protein